MSELLSIFSAFGLSTSAGLNADIPLLVVSLLAKFTNLIELQKPWDVLTNWWIIGLLCVLLLIEIFADKAPAVNHINDIVHTIVRPAAGAIVFAASANVITEIHPVLSLALGLLISGGVHATKALAVRPAVTATTAGTGNVVVSVLEDVVATILSILAVILPILIACILVIVTAWIVMRIIRRRRREEELDTV
jgi:hypothetical protein